MVLIVGVNFSFDSFRIAFGVLILEKNFGPLQIPLHLFTASKATLQVFLSRTKPYTVSLLHLAFAFLNLIFEPQF